MEDNSNLILDYQYSKNLLIVAVVAGAMFLSAGDVLAYDNDTTHPALTDDTVDFYDASYPNDQLTSQEKEWVIQGSILEDAAPRWINHFYDPIRKIGWSGEKISGVPASLVITLSTIGLTPESALSATEWVNNFLVQQTYSRYEGNRTWRKALEYFADGNKEEAYKTLGYILHVLEDMSVPEHTRNDSHIDGLDTMVGNYGSPYEEYTERYNRSTIKNLNLVTTLKEGNSRPIIKSSPGDYLISLAEYSNRYFFSKDTVNDQKYQYPRIIKEDNDFGYGVDENNKEFPMARLKLIKEGDGSTKKFYFIENINTYYSILDAYFSRLSRQAILHGAGLINLFKRQAAEAVIRREYPSRLVRIDTSPFIIPSISLFGEGAKAWSATKSLLAQAAGLVSGAISSTQNFFAVLFGTGDSGLKPAGQLTISDSPARISQVTGAISKRKGSSNAISSISQTKGRQKTKEKAPTGPVSNQEELAKTINQTIPLEENNSFHEKDLTRNSTTLKEGNHVQEVDQIQLVDNSAQSNKKEPIRRCRFATSEQPLRRGVILNEVAWMGGLNSASDEWIELKNISNNEIDVRDWQLIDQGESMKIDFNSVKGPKVQPGGFVLLERTDDSSVPNIIADLIYTGALANSNEGLRLFDSQCHLVDEALANPDWPAGDSTLRKTMERNNNYAGWHTSVNPGGTPKEENSLPILVFGGGSPPIVNQVNNSKSSAVSSSRVSSKILISEVQITGGPGKTDDDFIELYNPNDEPVNLNGYRLVKRTKTGTNDISIKSWSDEAMIPGRGYYLWANSNYSNISADVTTSAYLANNNGIAIRYGPEDTGNIIDSVGWGEAQNAFVEGNAFNLNPAARQSIQRKFQNNNFVDTNNNLNDFELKNCPSPKAQSRECVSSFINEAPRAFFNYSPSSTTVGDSVIFTASSSNFESSTTSYLWDFGDNTASGTSGATTSHSYGFAGSFTASLLAFDGAGASSTATLSILVQARVARRVLISEVLFNPRGNDAASKEFIELYNPSDSDIDLKSWSLRIIGSESTSSKSLAKIGSKIEDITLLKAKSFLLIGFGGYVGAPAGDVVRSAILPNSSSTIYLLDENSEEVDSVSYDERVPEGQSWERKAASKEECVSATGAGEFLGNGCNRDSVSDFEVRITPNPQNSGNLAEPRSAPSAPDSFVINYNQDALNLLFNWQPSVDAPGSTTTIIYEIRDLLNFNKIIFRASSTNEFSMRITEAGRDYEFSIQAFDRDGLGSASVPRTITIPSLLRSLFFYRESPSSSDYLLKISYDKYPFVPDLLAQHHWKIAVFYLNSDPADAGIFYEARNLEPTDLTNVLSIKYRRCSGGAVASGYSLILPDTIDNCGVWGGAMNIALHWYEVGNDQIIIRVNNPRNFSNSDYVTAAYYTPTGSSPALGYAFQLAALDKHRYYFRDLIPSE